MGTSATYRLFVGVSVEAIERMEVRAADFFWRICEDDLEEDGLTFTSFCFNGDRVAVGVQVSELDWTTGIGQDNEYDAGVAEEAQRTLEAVNKVLKKQGTPVTAKLYHYLDLR